MKKNVADLRLFLGLICAHILLNITYDDKAVFWYIFTATILFLVSIAILSERMDDELSILPYLLYGVLSGALLYSVFWIGYNIMKLFDISPLVNDVAKLYNIYAPQMIWQYVVLLFIIIPGEEIFWRGFIHKRISRLFHKKWGIPLSAFMYTLPLIYSGNKALLVAGFVAGLFWGFLYEWKKSLPLVIISHLTFDLLLLYIFPFL